MKTASRPVALLWLGILVLAPWLPARATSPETFRHLLRDYMRTAAAAETDDSDDSNDFDDTDDRFAALLGPDDSDDVDAEVNAALGLLLIRKNEFNFYTGSVTIGGTRFRIKGRFNRAGVENRTLIKDGRRLDLAMQLGPSGARLFGSVTPRDGGLTSLLDTGRSRFRPRQPSENRGRYTVLFPGDDQSVATGFPKGDGFGVLRVGRLGQTRMAGRLADGTAISFGIPVSVAGQVPVYRPLFRRQGSISGIVEFAENPGVSDASGTVSVFKPASGRPGQLYAGGYSIKVPFLASRYVRPRGTRILEQLDATNGAAEVTFGEGNLLDDLSQLVVIDPRNRVAIEGVPDVPLSMKIKKKTGLFSGQFRIGGESRGTKFRGAFYQSQGIAGGFFLGGTESGFVRLAPAVP